MHEKYNEQGLRILAFPCNQFGGQDPYTEEGIKEFVKKFNTQYKFFSKIDVNGPNTHPVYKFLKECLPGDITWNFASKFVVNQDGVPVKRFEKESYEEMEQFFVELLNKQIKDNGPQ